MVTPFEATPRDARATGFESPRVHLRMCPQRLTPASSRKRLIPSAPTVASSVAEISVCHFSGGGS